MKKFKEIQILVKASRMCHGSISGKERTLTSGGGGILVEHSLLCRLTSSLSTDLVFISDVSRLLLVKLRRHASLHFALVKSCTHDDDDARASR